MVAVFHQRNSRMFPSIFNAFYILIWPWGLVYTLALFQSLFFYLLSLIFVYNEYFSHALSCWSCLHLSRLLLGPFDPTKDLTGPSCCHRVITKSCVRLFCNPKKCSLPGSSVHGISQTQDQSWSQERDNAEEFHTEDFSGTFSWLQIITNIRPKFHT